MPGRSIAASGVAKALTDTATSHSTHQLLPFLCPRLFPEDAASTQPLPSRRRIRHLSSSSASPAALALQAEAAPVNRATILPSIHQFTPPRTPSAISEVDLRNSVMKQLQEILQSSSADPKGKATTPSRAARRLKAVEDQIRGSALRDDSAVFGELVKAFVALDQVGEALDRIKEAAGRSLSLDVNVFRSVARNLEANHLYHHIPLLFELSERVLGRTSFRMLEENARALVKLKNYAALKPILKLYDTAGLTPRTGTYNRILQAHLQNCDVISAQDVILHMRRSGVTMNSRTYAAALAGARRMGMTKAVRRILGMTRTAATTSTVTLNAALRYHVQENNLPAIVQALKQFGMEGAPGTTDLVPPDGHTFAVIIHRLSQIGELPKAVQAFAHAVEHGISPTYTMTAALVKAHVDNRDLLGAFRLLSEMCQGQAERDAVLIDLLLQRLGVVVAKAAVSGRRRAAEDTRTRTEPEAMKLCDWKEMELRSLHFADLLEVVTRRIGADGAVPILLLMRALSQPMTVRIFHILASRIPAASTARLATVLEPMIRETKDPAVMQAAANLLEKRQLQQSRRKTLPHFSNSAILGGIRQAKTARSKSSTRRARITVSTKRHHVTTVASRLRPVSDRLRSLGVCPDRNTYAIQIHQAAIMDGNTPKARKLFQAMIEAGLKPDIRHYSALIQGYVLQGNMGAAKYMMREYQRHLVPAKAVGSRFDGRYKSRSSGSSSIINLGLGNVVLWTLLIVGYGRIHRPDQARLAMEEMVREGVAPDVHSVHALAQVHLAHNKGAAAKAALLDFWPAEAGPLTDELKKLRVRKLLKAMWKQADKPESRKTGGPPEWNGLTKKELLEVRSGLDKIAAVWRGESVSSGPSARLLEELERLPKASRGPSEERLAPGTLPGRSNLVSKYPAKPWSERS